MRTLNDGFVMPNMTADEPYRREFAVMLDHMAIE